MSVVEGDRGIPPLGAQGGVSGRVRFMLIFVVVLVFAGVFGWAIYSKVVKQHAEDEEPEQKEEREAIGETIKAPPSYVTGALDARRRDEVQPESAAPAAASSSTATKPPPPPREPTQEERDAADLAERRQRAPVLAFSAANGESILSLAPSGDDGYSAAVSAALQAAQSVPAAPEPVTLGDQLIGDDFDGAVASRIGDMNFTMAQGTLGRCAMRTAFNSELSGFASCVLTAPVYSANGKFVLWEAGSEVTGTFQTAQLRTGSARAFVLWTRVRTPYGVIVNLDSPATDAQGRAGIAGKVNRHFWQRFGAALLVSVVDSAASLALSSGSGGNTNVALGSAGGAGRDAAALIVEGSAGIPPTLSVEAGAIVNVFVARDLYFGDVYGFKLRPSGGTQ